MKAFLTSLVAVIAIGLASDFIFGGPVSQYESDAPVLKYVFTGDADRSPLIDTSAAAANISPNVRLPGQSVSDEETQ